MTKPIEMMGLGPKREVRVEGGQYVVTVTPPSWSGFGASRLRLNADQFSRYSRWLDAGCLIQEALPELTDAEREILVSGIGPDEWEMTR